MLQMTRKLRGKRGFTMVELLVVIIIISVLVAIALPRYFAAIYAGRVRACQSNFKVIETAAQAYFTSNKAWPTLVTDMLEPGAAGVTTPAGMKGGQLAERAFCPFETVASPKPYLLTATYETPGNASTPQVGVIVAETGHFAAGTWQNASIHLP